MNTLNTMNMGWCEGKVAVTLPEAVVYHPIIDGVRRPVQSAAEKKLQHEQQRLHHHYVSGFMLHHHDLAANFLKQVAFSSPLPVLLCY